MLHGQRLLTSPQAAGPTVKYKIQTHCHITKSVPTHYRFLKRLDFASHPPLTRQRLAACSKPLAAACALPSQPSQVPDNLPDLPSPAPAGNGHVAGQAGTMLATLRSWQATASRLQGQLRAYGVAGLLAYGFLNTLYYTAAFLVYWLLVAKVTRGAGLKIIGSRFVEAMAITWAGSQVTKIPRAAAALILAPCCDRAIDWCQTKLGWQHRGQVVGLMVLSCLTFAGAVLGGTLLLWA